MPKYIVVLPLPDAYTVDTLVSLFMSHEYLHFRYPLNIVIVNNTIFHSTVWLGFCKLNCISPSFSTPNHSESDGQLKIANEAILTILRAKQLEYGSSWFPSIPLVQEAINILVDDIRGYTPHSLIFKFFLHLHRYPCWLTCPYSQTRWSDSSHVGSSVEEDEQQPRGNH